MDSQETCNRMKAVCLENGLPIWEDEIAFIYNKELGNEFYYANDFRVLYDSYKTQVTEAEFLELLKEYKNGIQNN